MYVNIFHDQMDGIVSKSVLKYTMESQHLAKYISKYTMESQHLARK